METEKKSTILPICVYGAKILEQEARPAAITDPYIDELIKYMKDTLNVFKGFGLAAPQVNVPFKIALVNKAVAKEKEDVVLLNPRLASFEGELIYKEEGCLSFPNLFLEIPRYEKVIVENQVREGGTLIIQASGLYARVLQHEIDHLNGKLFFQHLTGNRKYLAKMKVRKWEINMRKIAKLQKAKVFTKRTQL